MTRNRGRLVVVGAVLAALAPWGVSASAASAGPQVGECYLLDQDVLTERGWWPDVSAVPCTERHTFEVTEVGPLPQDANAFDFARAQCGAPELWSALGVNLPLSGIVRSPLRVVPWSFAVRQAPGTYVCGGVALSYQGVADPIAIPLTTSIKDLSRRERSALRHCSDASNGRGALRPPVTVRCASRPSWLVTSWVIWKAFYDEYPGRVELRKRAKDLCGTDRVASLPSRADWDAGLPMTSCYRLRG